jgi:hypothetical protein
MQDLQKELKHMMRNGKKAEKSSMEIFVDVLEILQEQGIDLSYLKRSTKDIKELIEVCNKNEMQIEESIVEKALSGIIAASGAQIDLSWKIGRQLNTVRREKEELREEMTKRQKEKSNVFSEEVIKSIVGKEKNSKEILVDVLEILQEQGMDLSYLKITTKSIKELIEECNKNGMQIEEKVVEKALSGMIAAYGKTIDLSWNIGIQLNEARRKKEALREEMSKRQKGKANIFSEDIIKSIVANEIKVEKNRIEILVDVLEILQEQGIDLSYLKQSTKNIKELIEVCNENGMQIEASVVEKSLSGMIVASRTKIDLSWLIGSQLNHARDKREELREEMRRRQKEGKNVFSENIMKSIVIGKSRIEILVDILEILQEQGIDLSYLKPTTKDIKELIEECSKSGIKVEEEVVKGALRGKLSAHGEQIDLSWNIGVNLHDARIEKETLREELEARKNSFNKDVIKSIVYGKSSMEILVDVLEILQEQGVDLRYLKPATKSIKELIEVCNKNGMQIEESRVEKALNGKRTAHKKAIDLTWKIGSQLYCARNGKKELKEEMRRRQRGEKNVFREEVINHIGGKIKGQQLGKAGFTAPVDKCDAAGRAIKKITSHRKSRG